METVSKRSVLTALDDAGTGLVIPGEFKEYKEYEEYKKAPGRSPNTPWTPRTPWTPSLAAVLLFSFAVTFGEVVETLLLSPITIALAAVFVLGCVIVLIWVFRGSGKPAVYLSVVDSLLTPAEKLFYEQLDLVIDGRLQILCKVRLADLIEVESRQPEERNRVFRRIASKHIDFVLAEPGSLAPMLAIELDDSSHERADRRERDEYLEELFQTVKFPLLRIKASATYNRRALVDALEQALRRRFQPY